MNITNQRKPITPRRFPLVRSLFLSPDLTRHNIQGVSLPQSHSLPTTLQKGRSRYASPIQRKGDQSVSFTYPIDPQVYLRSLRSIVAGRFRWKKRVYSEGKKDKSSAYREQDSDFIGKRERKKENKKVGTRPFVETAATQPPSLTLHHTICSTEVTKRCNNTKKSSASPLHT